MRKILTLLAAAAAALTSSVGIAREPETRFVHEGTTYVYTSIPQSNGRQVIEGYRLPNGNRFRLVVRGNRVSGVAGGVPVAFRVADARGAADGADRGFAAVGN